MRVSYEIFTVPKKLFELRRCSNNRKSNYRESTVCPNLKRKLIVSFQISRFINIWTKSGQNSMVAIATKELKIYIQISLKFLPCPGTPCKKTCI